MFNKRLIVFLLLQRPFSASAPAHRIASPLQGGGAGSVRSLWRWQQGQLAAGTGQCACAATWPCSCCAVRRVNRARRRRPPA
jgi:hypothetical protein